MTEQQIINQVEVILKKAENNQEIENPKVEFKREWYKLKEKGKSYFEFLKDTSSIANTFGLDGFIIIGFDEKQKSYFSAKFHDTGLNDTSKVYPLINKNVADPFDINIYDIEINGNFLSVIHLPGSINKPHVIKLFKRFDKNGNSKDEQNKIFVRKDTGIYTASKYDLELMYYDKKNNIPEYEIRVDATKIDFKQHDHHAIPKTQFVIFFTIENLGRRVIAINKMWINVLFPDNTELKFNLTGEINPVSGTSSIENKAYIIKSNDIDFFTKLMFMAKGTIDIKTKKELMKSKYFLNLEMVNSKILSAQINK